MTSGESLFSGIQFIDDPAFVCEGKRVLMRVDFNVPMDDEGRITNDKRLRESVPSIQLLRERSAKVVLMSHLGRPKGEKDAKFSLAPVARALGELIQHPVSFVEDCIGEGVVKRTQDADFAGGDVLLLENVRFHLAETKEYETFGAELAKNGDLFVNDAFGSCHRAHGSVAGVPLVLPSAAGLLIRKEIEAFTSVLENPARPLVAVLGGAKVSDKIGVIENLLERVDALIIGGGMAYTFLAARGESIGNSLFESEQEQFAAGLIEKAKEKGVALHLPKDHVIASSIDGEDARESKSIPDGFAAFDIGPETRKQFAHALESAKTIVFNGPMGVFEKDCFAAGTRAVLEGMARAHSQGAKVIVGGGDSAAAVELLGFESSVSHISTGGGASLELLEGKVLPGIAALRESR